MALTVGQLQGLAEIFSAKFSVFLTGLADGKYDSEVAVDENMLKELATIWAPALGIEQGLELFIWLNKETAPHARIVPDGHGGQVPFNFPRVMPDGSLRDYDPKIDGV